jgi:A/G-specific adenine glycosylase
MAEIFSDLIGFQNWVKRYHARYGRHELPWRQDFAPYKVLVSELMLQQTQVERVIPKFQAFIQSFPDWSTLAAAPISEIITHWQGLGYNRRGLNLHRTAQQVVNQHQGTLPNDEAGLLALPGIGPYTASAIQAFAFNQPSIVIETNIRTVFIHHFFPGAYQVPDAQLLPLIQQTLDTAHPREWYAGLMDYGTYLKSVLPNPTRRSQQYVKQSNFVGSNRQLRGELLRHITHHHRQTTAQILHHVAEVLPTRTVDQVLSNLQQLQTEGFIQEKPDGWRLASNA